MFGIFLIVLISWVFFRPHFRKAVSYIWRQVDFDNYILKSSKKKLASNQLPSGLKEPDREKIEKSDIHKWLDEQDARISALPEILSLPLVKLTPSFENAPTQSWFRGPARFPLSIEWPKVSGKDMLFIGQIHLNGLPDQLWYGHGLRSGWLLFFMALDGNRHIAKAVHTPELGPERIGPKSSDAQWYRVWGSNNQAWPDEIPAYLNTEVVNLARTSVSDRWPEFWPQRSDPNCDQTAFLGGDRDLAGGYPLFDGYDVPLMQLPSDPKFGWDWHDLGPGYISARSQEVDAMQFNKLDFSCEP